MKNKPIHPCEIILNKLRGRDTLRTLSEKTGISPATLSRLCNGEGNITIYTAYKLSKFSKTTTEYWLDLQNKYDNHRQKLHETCTKSMMYSDK